MKEIDHKSRVGTVQWRADCEREPEFGVLCDMPLATEYTVQSDCQHNQYLAAVNRVACNWPEATDLSGVQRVADRLADCLGVNETVPFAVWGAKYSGMKLRRYQAALASLESRPITRKDSYIQAFVKREKLVDAAKDPRMIQARGARFNVALGSYLKAFEHRLYNIRGTGPLKRWLPAGRLIVKGMNAVARAALLQVHWDSLSHPVQLGLDCSRFDAHCSEALLRVEHSVYLKAFRGDPTLARLLAYQLRNRCFTRSGLEYEVIGRRMSGDMNTALGNCVLMVCMMAAAMEEIGLNPKHWRMADDGDDCCIMVEREVADMVAERLPEIFRKFGHTLKVESRADTLERVVLCGASPVMVGDVRRMITNPGRAIGKAKVHTKVFKGKFLADYVATIGECMLHMHAGVPVLQAHALALRRASKTLLRETPGSYLYKLDPGSVLGAASSIPVADSTRESFAVAFGVSVVAQLEAEAWFHACQPDQLLRLAPPLEVPGDNYYV